MSYLSPSPFNFTFAPSSPASTLFQGFGSQTSYNSVPNRFVTQKPLPQSIAQEYQGGQSSYTDYYGNPAQPQNAYQQSTQTQNFQTYQTFPQNYPQEEKNNFEQQQPQRRRRPKNRRNQQQQPTTYGADHVEAIQNFNQNQNPQQQNQGLLGHPQHPFVRFTPIQGPIFAKDGHLPVVPLYSYNAVKNGTLYQIPILWTALSYALGLEIRGEILRGLPCIKRLNQLFCPTAGNTYPLNNIEQFIDENKALIKRMYGEFMMNSPESSPLTGAPSTGGNALRRSAREVYESEVEEFFGKSKNSKLSHLAENLKNEDEEIGETHPHNSTEKVRKVRQTVNPKNGNPTQQPKSNRVDSCESMVEITTPYWAANSAGKVRAIVNTQHFEQAIQQEVCSKTSTKHCVGDCGCEQKYKWHRLLAYDPDNDCRGIFMDWFLFPSCCVCRCNP